MDLISYFAVQHQIGIYHGECWTLSGFNCCLACFYAVDLASAEAEIRHVFGDTLITEASIGATPPGVLVKLSEYSSVIEIIKE